MNVSCTDKCEAYTGTLYGKSNGIPIRVVDMPGLFDTEDSKAKKGEKPKSM